MRARVVQAGQSADRPRQYGHGQLLTKGAKAVKATRVRGLLSFGLEGLRGTYDTSASSLPAGQSHGCGTGRR
jgi:hypothetical protein